MPRNLQFLDDVVFGADNTTIEASRCHVFSENVLESTQQAELMIRMRNLADGAEFPVFAYQVWCISENFYCLFMLSVKRL